jgi:hypothetical protein
MLNVSLRIRSARVFGCISWVLGLWVFLEGRSGFIVGFGGCVEFGCLRGRFVCLMGGFYFFGDLGFMWVLGVVGV